MDLRFISKIVNFFHVCEFKWDLGYGMMGTLGTGTYEFECCRKCGNLTGKIRNFKRDEY